MGIFGYNNVNALTSPAPVSYAKDGEPLKLGSQTFQWDAVQIRLISVSTVNYMTGFAYDGRNRRERITQLTGKIIVSDKFLLLVWRGERTLPGNPRSQP